MKLFSKKVYPELKNESVAMFIINRTDFIDNIVQSYNMFSDKFKKFIALVSGTIDNITLRRYLEKHSIEPIFFPFNDDENESIEHAVNMTNYTHIFLMYDDFAYKKSYYDSLIQSKAVISSVSVLKGYYDEMFYKVITKRVVMINKTKNKKQSLKFKNMVDFDMYDHMVRILFEKPETKPLHWCHCDHECVKKYTLKRRVDTMIENYKNVRQYLRKVTIPSRVSKLRIGVICSEFDKTLMKNVGDIVDMSDLNVKGVDCIIVKPYSSDCDLFDNDRYKSMVHKVKSAGTKIVLWDSISYKDNNPFKLYYKDFDLVVVTDYLVHAKNEATTVNLNMFTNPTIFNNINRKICSNGTVGFTVVDISESVIDNITKFIPKTKFYIVDTGQNTFMSSKLNDKLLILKPLNISNLYRQVDYYLSITTTPDSQTLFDRSGLDAIVSKIDVVSTKSIGMVQQFYGTLLKKIVCSKTIPLEREIVKHIAWRKVMTNYNIFNIFNTMLHHLGINKSTEMFDQTMITVVAVVAPYEIESVIDNFNRQTYKNKQLILFTDNLTKDIDMMDNIVLMRRLETRGECYNYAIKYASGNYITFFDPDDFYGNNYLLDMWYTLKLSNSTLVGKCAHYSYNSKTCDMTIKNYNMGFEKKIASPNMLCTKTLFFDITVLRNYDKKFKETDIGPSIDLVNDIKSMEFGVVAADIFNYCSINKSNIDVDNFIGVAQTIGKFDKIPTDIIDI